MQVKMAMIVLAIQIILNIIVFIIIPQRKLDRFKLFFYFIYPVILVAPVIAEILGWLLSTTDRQQGLAVDITYLANKQTLGILMMTIGIQFIFNNKIKDLFDKRPTR